MLSRRNFFLNSVLLGVAGIVPINVNGSPDSSDKLVRLVDSDSAQLLAGVSQIDVTPTLGTIINGEFTNRYAQSISDPLFVKSLVFKKGKELFGFVVVDNTAMRHDFIEDVKKRIYEKTGVTRGQILISCTHTHTAGSVADLLLGHVDIEYTEKLKNGIVKGFVEALAKFQPVEIGVGRVDVPEHVVCRRYIMKEGYAKAVNPITGQREKVKTNARDVSEIVSRTSTPDPELSFLVVKTLTGKYLSVLANYSLHYVGDFDENTISADYFGKFADYLKQKLNPDGEFVGIMSNGTSGDVNIWDFLEPNRYPTEPHAKSKLIAEDLANKLLAKLKSVKFQKDVELTYAYDDLNVATEKPSKNDLEAAEKILKETNFSSISTDKEQIKRIYAREQLLLADYPDTVTFPIQTIKLGPYVIGALGGEIFAETGRKIKQDNPNYLFTICLANDDVGYVPPKHEFQYGGYETWRNRTRFLTKNSEEKIRLSLDKTIKSISKVSK